MTTFANVRRYCAIEGIECEKRILYKGSWTYFFAYPGSNHWTDFTSTLASELGFRGFYGERWQDTVNNDLLFSKVCEGIYGHDFLLAEVTEPNPNVMLEIGYALAVGREPILLKNTNHKGWSRTLLTTLESCHYEKREDILSYIAALQAKERRSPDAPDRRLPFLENMGIFDYSEIRGTVYHLKPKVSADWISTVDRTLKGSYFRLTTMDPSDSVSDEFYPQAREIQRASLIVASLVSSTTLDWEQQNANVALLIGFAIGLGKQLLVLQENPLAPILDLGTVSRPIDTETQAGQIVQAWITAQTQSLVSRAEDSRRQAHTREQVDRMRKLYLGHPDALQDNRLLDYFVPTKEFDDAIEGRRAIFIGRKGAGKSANFQAIKETLRERAGAVTVAIAPDDFELERISAFLERSYSLVNPSLVFQSTWNYVIISEMLKSLANNSDMLYLSPNDQVRTNLYEYYDTNQPLLGLDFGTRVVSVLTEAATLEEKEDEQEILKSLRDYQVNRQLKEFAIRENIVFHVVADDLDKHWRPDSRQSIDLLIGLIAETDRLQRFFEGHLKVVMFLREDIYNVLSQVDEDLPKRNILRMEWTKTNLMHLIAERLASVADESNEDDETTWSAIFPDSVKGQSAQEYILSRTLPRPRDVLDFCQKSIDQAQRNGHSAVTEQDVLDGEASFSEAVFWSVCAEFRGLYPNLENILIEFAGVEEKLSWPEFERISLKAIEKNQHIWAAWIRNGEMTPLSLAEILFGVGVIGLSGGASVSPHYANGRSFAETWNLVNPSPAVLVHAAFAHFLDVARVSVRSPRIPRRPRGIDPRQLRLEESP